MIDQNEFIDSTKMIVEKVRDNHSQDAAINISESKARKVMTGMNMKYRKVNHIAMSANS